MEAKAPEPKKHRAIKTWLDDFPGWVRTMVQLGAIGVLIYFYNEDRREAKAERNAAAQVSREDHREAFKTMREDDKNAIKFHSEENEKTRDVIRKSATTQRELAKTMTEGLAVVKTIQEENRVNQRSIVESQKELYRLMTVVESLAKEIKNMKDSQFQTPH